MLWLPLSLHAQHVADSLWRRANDAALPDTARLLALEDLSETIRGRWQDSAFHLSSTVLSRSKRIPYYKTMGRAMRSLAVYYRSIGEIPKALAYNDSAIQFCQQAHDPRGLARAQLSKGLILQEQGKFNQALQLDYAALKVFEKLNDKRNITVLNQNIGLVHYDQRNYAKAIEYLVKAAEQSAFIQEPHLAGSIYGNLGYVYQTQGNFSAALENQFKALRILLDGEDFRTATYPYNSLAEIYIAKKDYPTALGYLTKGLAIAEKNNYEDRISDLSKTYAQYCIATRDYARALHFARRAEQLAEKVQNIELMRNAQEQLYLAASAKGDFRQALINYQQFRAAKDSMQDEEIRRNSMAQEFAFQEERLKLENQALQHEAQLKEEQLQRTRFFLIVIGALTIVIGYLAYRYFRSFRKNKNLNDVIGAQNLELHAKQEEISAQNEELLQSHEEISAHRDLVETQNQELTQAKLLIEKQNEEIKKRNANLNQEVESRTRELLEYTQQLEQFAFVSSHNLRAPVARILGLGQMLHLTGRTAADEQFITESLIKSSQELDRIVRDLNTILEVKQGTLSAAVDISLDEELPLIMINLEKETTEANADVKWNFSDAPVLKTVRPYLDSILMNLLSNAVKYRDPNRPLKVQLSTEHRGDAICLTVKDNGLGIDLDKYGDRLFKLYSRFHLHVDGKGLGLHLVKTQMSALGGRIDVDSKVNEGTTFALYFPKM